MTKKYNIKYKTNVRLPNIGSDWDADNDHRFSLQNLKKRIEQQILTSYLGHPLFDTNFDQKTKDIKLNTIRKTARYIIEFPCGGDRVLSAQQYGVAALNNPRCVNGKFRIIGSIPDLPQHRAFLPDIFSGSKDGIPTPMITLEFEEISRVKYYILYNLSMQIILDINCDNRNVFSIELPAFSSKMGEKGKTATFLVSSKNDPSSRVYTNWIYGIDKKTTLVRTPIGTSKFGKLVYRWTPVGNGPSFDSLLYDNDYDHYTPRSIDEYEPPTVNDDGKTIISENSYPGNSEMNELLKKTNLLVGKFLTLRIKQLQHTLKDEIIALESWEGISHEDAAKVLDFLNKNNCNTNIMVSGFKIDQNDTGLDGFVLSQKQQDSPITIATEEDILAQFPDSNDLK